MMREIIQKSYDVLTPDTQEVFQRLSVVRPSPQSFSKSLVCALCAKDEAITEDKIDAALLELSGFCLIQNYEIAPAEKSFAGENPADSMDSHYQMHAVISDFLKDLIPQASRSEWNRLAIEFFQKKMDELEEELGRSGDCTSFKDALIYEDRNWLACVDDWFHHVSETNRRKAFHHFLSHYFFAFWWWGLYQSDDDYPYCRMFLDTWERLPVPNDETNALPPADMEEEEAGFKALQRFHELYPREGVKIDTNDRTNSIHNWQEIHKELEKVRAAAKLEGSWESLEFAHQRQAKGFLEYFLAESHAYGWIGELPNKEVEREYQDVANIFLSLANRGLVLPYLYFELGQVLSGDDRLDYQLAEGYCHLSLLVSSEKQKLEDRDPEVLAKTHGLLGILLLKQGKHFQEATQHICLSAFYALAYQAVPDGPDTYTTEFYFNELAIVLLDEIIEWSMEHRAEAIEICKNLQSLLSYGRRKDDLLQELTDAMWEDQLTKAAQEDPSTGGSARDTLKNWIFPATISREKLSDEVIRAKYKDSVHEAIEKMTQWLKERDWLTWDIPEENEATDKCP